jgi:serine/threonine protein kinase
MNRLSPASDVYSFGIVMSEMLTWQIPFAELLKEQVGAGSSTCEVEHCWEVVCEVPALMC